MSCLRGRKIRNPKLQPTGEDKPYITIPDGRCAECRKRKTNDYLVRAYFEFISRPHDVFAVCLDFDDEHLPMYNGVPCFDYSIFKLFYRQLRDNLPDFRYLAVPHLGDAFNRPHYHIVFFFPRESKVSYATVESMINKFWVYGSHENVQDLSSDKTPFGIVNYVCQYAVQGENYFKIKKEFREQMVDLPYRYRPHIHSSIGFGCQCLDPKEFNSERLISEDVRFLDTPVITKEYMRKNSLVYIIKDPSHPDIKIPFAIPRYYEQKLFFHSSWDPVEKKQSLTRTAEGMELSRIRHDVHYKYYFRQFCMSKYENYTSDLQIMNIFKRAYPDSPYLGLVWRDVVEDVLQDPEKFLDYCRIRDFLELWDYSDFIKKVNKNFYISLAKSDWFWYQLMPRSYWSVHHHIQYYIGRTMDNDRQIYTFISDCELYVQAAFIFDLANKLRNEKIAYYKDFQMVEATKAKIRSRCLKRPDYFAYLKRKHFDFSSILPSSYSP